MCYRKNCSLSKDEIISRLQSMFGGRRKFQWRSDCAPGEYKPSFNIAPGSYIPVVIAPSHIHTKFNLAPGSEIVQVMRWGLIPSFLSNSLECTSSSKFATANARAETILERPSYMDCIKHRRRCVIIAQGFYEWRRQDNGRKVPYYVSMCGEHEPLMLMAGVFSVDKAQTLFSYSVITTEAVNEISRLHNRMPVVFADLEDIFEWINPNLCSPISTVRFLKCLTDKLRTLELRIYPVTPRMNSTSFNCQQCIEPIDPSEPIVHDFPKEKKISDFFMAKRPNIEESETAVSEDEDESVLKKKFKTL